MPDLMTGLDAATLPHPDIPQRQWLVVEKVLFEAWGLLLNLPPTTLDISLATEDEITSELHKAIEDLRYGERLPGFTAAIFETTSREGNLCSFDNASIDKQPDLVFRLVGKHPGVARPEQHGLFIECKPIDTRHPIGSNYCAKGVIRFVSGEYAWAMTSAMMVGYVRDTQYTIKKLGSALKKDLKKYETLELPRKCQLPSRSYRSKHDRVWKYPVLTNNSPGPIVLRHLWLEVS